jgi:hypothetical protein
MVKFPIPKSGKQVLEPDPHLEYSIADQSSPLERVPPPTGTVLGKV